MEGALVWLAFSGSKLSLAEVAEAAIVNTKHQTFYPEDRFFDIRNLLEICGNFVSCDHGRYKVVKLPEGNYNEGDHDCLRLSHASVKEYIQSKLFDKAWLLKFDLVNIDVAEFLAETSLIYLLSIRESFQSPEELRDRYPFGQFTANNWYNYYSKIPEDDIQRARDLMVSLFDFESHEQAYLNWLELSGNAGYGRSWAPLLIVTRVGMHLVVEALLNKIAASEASKSDLSDTLIVTSRKGDAHSAQMLLVAGAGVNDKASPALAAAAMGSTALEAAVLHSRVRVVQVLIEAGANVDIRAQSWHNPQSTHSHSACSIGLGTIAEMLAREKADIHAYGGAYGVVLRIPVEHG